MIVSRASLASLILPLSALAWVPALPALPVAAQQVETAPIGAPTPLRPREPRPDRDDAARPPADTVQPFVPPTLDTLIPAPVQVETLDGLDPDSVGVLDTADGGFPADLWRGLDRAQVSGLLGMLPGGITSPAMRDLAHRLLLSRAAPPQGDRAGSGLLAARVRALLEMGDAESALALLRNAPPGHENDGLARLEVEARFLLNDNGAACDRARSRAPGVLDSYWQQASAYCLALSGQPDRAALMADILAERRDNVSPAFFAAMDTFSGMRGVKVGTVGEAAALHVSMMRAASLEVPPDVLEASSPALMRAIAASPNAPLKVRLEAAERALGIGAVSLETLREISASVPVGEEAQERPLSFAEENWGPEARAILARAAGAQGVPTARAEVLQLGYRLGLARGGYRAFLMASLPDLVDIAPAGELAWFASDAGLALFAAGRVAEAARWYDFVRREAGRGSDARAAADTLWPLAHVAGVAEEPDRAAARNAWWKARMDAKDAGAAARAETLFSLVEALGETVDPALWRAVLRHDEPGAVSSAPPPALRRALAAAVRDGRLGEGVALVLVILGGDGPRAAGIVAVEESVSALRQLGLEAEARAVALEAAVAGSL